MDKSSRNERRKVAAQYLNGIAIAVLVTGVVGPALGQFSEARTIVVAILASLALHLAARQAVGYIED